MKVREAMALRTEKWYGMEQSEDGEKAEIRLDGVIGGSFWEEGTDAKTFAAAFAALTAKEITVRINSCGGSVTEGVSIYNQLKAARMAGKTVTVYIEGLAASIASVIAMAGSRIVMAENSFMLVHQPWSFQCGNALLLRASADDLDAIARQMCATYTARTRQSAEKITEVMNGQPGHDGTLLSAAECVELGFADEVEKNVAAAACAGAAIFSGIPAALIRAEGPCDPATRKPEKSEEPETTPEEPPEEPETPPNPPEPTEKPEEPEEPEKPEKPEKPEDDPDDDDDPEKLKEENAALRRELASMRLAPTIDVNLSGEGKAVKSFREALTACGGDYVKARKKYPNFFKF